MFNVSAKDFGEWRSLARRLITAGIPPQHVQWHFSNAPQAGLFGESLPPEIKTATFSVPRDFYTLAEKVACHRDDARWGLLYAALWRILHGEPHLLSLVTDPLIHRLETMEKQVRRDAHKTKAFVRFRLTEEDGEEHYIAWHRPDHFILPLVAPFFARRFSSMQWTVLTPDASVHWDLESLHYGTGVPASEAPDEDILEDLWRDYYRAIFNPARIKIKAMKREMPVRHWKTLPEASIIHDLLREAPTRMEQMIAHREGLATSAADFMPEKRSLPNLREAAKGCQGCPLFEDATQTVFGEGPAGAPLMLVGEQPGDMEDQSGHPFVGPAGAVLNQALERAGIPREKVYVTNAVKHFRFNFVGEQRQHRSPTLHHIHACKPWLVSEMAAVKPQAIVCLGNTAARSLISHGFTMKTGRGQWAEVNGERIIATYHPSAILRGDSRQRDLFMDYLVEDLAKAASVITENAN